MKTIVFAYSEFGCIGIEALVTAGYDIAAVFTYRDDPQETVFYRSVAKVCIAHDIPAYTIDPDNQTARFAMMQGIAPDFIFSFYYRSLISDAILALARLGAYNLHGSLLPDYRGRAPVNWVLVNGETKTGVTLHHMTTRADAGDIVAQIPVDIAYEDTAFTLQHKLLAAANRLFQTQLPLIAQGKAARIKQDISTGRYFGRRGPADGLIDWTLPAENIRNLIRAVTTPYPGAHTFVGARKLMIWEAVAILLPRNKCGAGSNLPPQAGEGIIISVQPLTVMCGQGALVVICGQIDDGLCLSGTQLPIEYGLKIEDRCTAKDRMI